ncbi:helix-turn-helix domain-containing protein [Lactobacillus helveticus]
MKKGLTQKQFADGIVSVSYYSKVEKTNIVLQQKI